MVAPRPTEPHRGHVSPWCRPAARPQANGSSWRGLGGGEPTRSIANCHFGPAAWLASCTRAHHRPPRPARFCCIRIEAVWPSITAGRWPLSWPPGRNNGAFSHVPAPGAPTSSSTCFGGQWSSPVPNSFGKTRTCGRQIVGVRRNRIICQLEPACWPCIAGAQMAPEGPNQSQTMG